MTDGELLHRYSRQQDQAAFTQFVQRHGGMILATARRLAAQDADDVVQAVFLLAAKKSASLSHHHNLAGWLYKVTRYCCNNARRAESRRLKQLQTIGEATVKNPSQPKSQPSDLLDAGLDRLAQHERQAVLLRYLEGLSLDETAAQLDISSAAVAKRAERGLNKLREFFERQGYTAAGATVTSLLHSQITQMPDSLLASLAKPTGAAMKLASMTSTAMTLVKLQIAAAVVLTLAGLTAATVAVTSSSKPSTPPKTVAMVTTAPATAPATMPALTQEAAQNSAHQFLTALKDHDADALADLVVGDTPEQRRASADAYILEFRDRDYAAYPQRLDSIEQNSFSSNMNGQLTDAIMAISPPIVADVRRLTLHLVPLDGKWRIKEAVFSGADTIAPMAMNDPAPTTSPQSAPPGTWAKAVEAHQKLMKDVDFQMDKMTEQDKPRVLQGIESAQSDLKQLTEILKPTDLHFDDQSLSRMLDFMKAMHDLLAEKGIKDLQAAQQDAMKNSPQLMADFGKLFDVGNQIGARADAEEMNNDKSNRPPAFGPDVELTMSWDQSKLTIPGPVKIPPWLRDTNSFKLWQQRHNLETFHPRDNQGNIYEVMCMGASLDQQGREHEMIPSVRQFRPDGTLAAMATYDDKGNATSWMTLDKTGKRYTMRVSLSESNQNEPPHVSEVIFFDEAGNQRILSVKAGNVVDMEWMNDPINQPIKTLHSTPTTKKAKRNAH